MIAFCAVSSQHFSSACRSLRPIGNRNIFGEVAAFLAAVCILFSVAVAHAQTTLTVTSLADSGTGTLRDAITQVNAGGIATDITFAPSLTGRTITLTGALPAIAGTVNIVGPSGGIAVSGGGSTTVGTIFIINIGATVTISGLTIENGKNIQGINGVGGGGVLNNGSLTVSNSTFTNLSTYYNGGGIYNNFGTLTITNSTFSNNAAGYAGGGIYSLGGTLTITNSTFSSNSGNGGGGVLMDAGTLTVTNSIFSNNSGNGGQGGAIAKLGGAANASYNLYYNNIALGVEADCTNCDSNSNATSATSIVLIPLGNYGGPTQTMPPLGVALCAGSLTKATDSNGNPLTADQRGLPMDAACPAGAVDAGAVQTQILIVNTAADDNDTNGGNYCTGKSGVPCSLRDAITSINHVSQTYTGINFSPSLGGSTIKLGTGSAGAIPLPGILNSVNIVGPSGGISVSGGGSTAVGNIFGIANGVTVEIDGLTIEDGKSTAFAGGISNSGTLIVTNSTLSGNSTTDTGGGILNLSGATLMVMNSTFSNNFASSGGCILSQDSGPLTITNSTFFNNAATSAGGCIYSANCKVTLTNSTFSNNFAGYSAGGIFNAGTLTLTNSIISDNSTNGAGGGGGILNFTPGTVTADHNVYYKNLNGGVEDDFEGYTDAESTISAYPVLAQLGNYGGPTQTMPPLQGSPGNTALCAGLRNIFLTSVTTDQRGALVPINGCNATGIIDAGSVQISGNPPMISSVSPSMGPMSGGTAVTIIGTGLDSVTGVAFGSIPADNSSIIMAPASGTTLASIKVASPQATSAGTVDLTVTNSAGDSLATPADRFTYIPPPEATVNKSSVVLTVGQAASTIQPVTGSGGYGSLSYSISPASLPAGLVFNNTTGAITATPTAYSAVATYTVTVKDSAGQTAAGQFSLQVDKISQAITSFAATPLSPTYSLNGTFTLSATGGASGNPVTFTSTTPAVCNVSGSMATILSAGVCSLLANQPETATYAAAPAVPLSVTINKATASISMTVSSTTVTAGQPITLTATVSDSSAGSTGTPTGTVSFFNGTTPLGTSTLANGVTTLQVNSLPVGTGQPLTLSYSGDGNFTALAQSAGATPVTITVQPANFTLAAPTTTSQTVTAGDSATFAFGFAPSTGSTYPCAVTFAATSSPALPAGYQITVKPTGLAVGAAAQSVSVQILTAKVASAMQPGWPFTAGTAALALLLLPLGILSRGRKLLSGHLLACVLALVTCLALLTAAGCGGGNGNGNSSNPPGNTTHSYNITLTGTSSCGPTINTLVTLTVQN